MAGCGDEIMVSLCIPPDVGCVYQGDAVGPCDGEGVSGLFTSDMFSFFCSG